LVRPPKELKGFVKVELQPGETKTVSVSLDFRAFAYYHPAYERWITEDGEFDILIGSSSADIRCVQTVALQSTLELPCLLHRESTLREWMEDPRGMSVLASFYEQVPAKVLATFFGGGENAIGMDTSSFYLSMPLPNLMHFLDNTLPTPPEDLVDELLARVHGTS
jgi:beta-glucosidase